MTNTNRVAGLCGEVKPTRDGKFPPKMENAEEELSGLVWDRAAEIYGDPLPERIRTRVEKELRSIVKNGFSVMYMIAQKLVAKSLADGYLVGSRGSVGSSLVAFLAGITEVNALEPHYVCPKCSHTEFYEGEEYSTGLDMPDRNCPVCSGRHEKGRLLHPLRDLSGLRRREGARHRPQFFRRVPGQGP